MRKISLMLVCLLFLAVVVPAANAQQNKTSDVSKFYINFGVISPSDFFSLYWQTGVMLDIPMGSNLLLTPEAMLVGWRFDFNEVHLYPGATINLKFGDEGKEFFIGGGLLACFVLAPSGPEMEIIPKIHGGFIGDNIKLTLYTHVFGFFSEGSGFFQSVYFGANVGFAL